MSSALDLNQFITPAERQEILDKWKTMPGNTCFMDAFYRIQKGL